MPITTTSEQQPDLFTTKDALETPSLLVDLETMDSNIQKYVELARKNNVQLRSHIKTHKNGEIARQQNRRSGDGGIVCQTLSEVEIMARQGLNDIYLSHMVVGDKKLKRLVWLSEKLDQFATTVDGPGNIKPLQAIAADHDNTVSVIMEIDVGLHRTGVPPGEDALETAKLIEDQPNLDLKGLLAYEAHVKSTAKTQSDYEQQCLEAMEQAQDTVELLESEGIPVQEVKVGGTATSKYSGKHPVVTEINPGMYPFMDVGEFEHRPFDVDKADCAATVLTTVISKPTADRAVVDAGSKTLSMDKPQYPVPKHRNDIQYVNASEEHGWLDTSEIEEPIDVGDKIEFIVPHVCTTINLHDTILGVQDEQVTEIWDVHARGRVK